MEKLFAKKISNIRYVFSIGITRKFGIMVVIHQHLDEHMLSCGDIIAATLLALCADVSVCVWELFINPFL